MCRIRCPGEPDLLFRLEAAPNERANRFSLRSQNQAPVPAKGSGRAPDELDDEEYEETKADTLEQLKEFEKSLQTIHREKHSGQRLG